MIKSPKLLSSASYRNQNKKEILHSATKMANSSCSHWWHAPFYIAMSLALAFVAITASIHHTANDSSTLSNLALKNNLTLKASKILRAHGFNVMATFLQLSPELFLSSSQESTIFAIPDSAIRNVSIPLHPWVIKQLLKYHTSLSNYPIKELFKKPQGSCLYTLLNNKPIKITKKDEENGVIEINDVLISHPDLFLEGPISIHGVLGSFSSIDFRGNDQDWDFIHSPTCDLEQSKQSTLFSSRMISNNSVVEWGKIVHLLGTNGFVSFAIGLNSVLDNIVQDSANLSSVTIFVPPYFTSMASTSPLLCRIVRLHVLPQRFTIAELASLPDKSTLKTLVADQDLEISMNTLSKTLMIDGVEITDPEIFLSKKFVVHGISHALQMEEISVLF